MATQLQIRRGTSAQVAAFTGAEGEIVVNTTNDSVHVNDGSTAGGFELARVDGSNWAITNAISTTANISFGDNDKAIFGAGSDLQIYHSGSASIIEDTGTGDLVIKGTDLYLRNASNSNRLYAGTDTRLYYDGNEKIRTTSTGIDVTGTAAADKLIVNSGATDEVARFEGTGSPYISWYDTGVRQAYIGSFGNNFSIVGDTPDTTVSISTGGTPRLTVDATGVGIGTSSPASNLEISDSTQSTGATFSITNSHDGLWTSGDKIGSIDFRIDDGSTTQKVRAKVHAEGRTTGTYPADSDLVFSTADNNTLSEAMRIDSAGRVGINSSAPASKLHVNTGSAGYGLTLAASSQTSGTYQLGIDSASNLAIYDTAAASQRLVISNAGKVGIGLSSPSSKLAIHGSADVAYFKQTNSNNSQTLEIGNAFSLYSGASGGVSAIASDSVLAFATADIERLRITSAGNVGIGTSSPTKTMVVNENDSECVVVIKSSDTGSAGVYLGGQSDEIKAGMILDNSTNALIFRGYNNAERLRISSTGNVGIGTGSPGNFQLNINGSGDGGRQLKVEGPSTNGLMRFSNSTSQDYSIGINSTSFIIYDDTANSYRMVLNSSGDLLLGTTGAQYNGKLAVWGSNPYLFEVRAQSGSTACAIMNQDNGASGTRNMILFRYAGTGVGTIQVTSSSTLYNTSSDQRLKENIADADDAGSKVDAIQVRKFDWIVDGSHQDYGMVAQELQSVAPEAVSGDADSDEMMGVDYSKLVPMLVKEIQSLRARVQQLENN